MEPSELLRFLVLALERLQVRYFVTGSTATIFYGEPRFTNDIDIVVALPESLIDAFCSEFPEGDFYVDAEAVRDAIRQRSQFNILHPRSGLKIDVIVPAATEFNRSRFDRVRRVHAGGDWDALFASPEDAILKKMEYFREGGSDKHLRDIAGVLKTSGAEIDNDYVERWAAILDLSEIWHDILKKVRESRG
jgi:hypothetical protein